MTTIETYKPTNEIRGKEYDTIGLLVLLADYGQDGIASYTAVRNGSGRVIGESVEITDDCAAALTASWTDPAENE